jgi:hypothetical protein
MPHLQQPGHRRSHARERLDKQIHDAQAGYVRRQRDLQEPSGSSDEVVKSLIALIFGLAAMGVVIFLAWNAGLFG